MKKVCSAILAALLMIALTSPAWACEKKPKKLPAKHDQHYFKIHKEKVHQTIISHEVSDLKKSFNKADPEAQQLFLTYLGTAVPSSDDQVQTLREGYEQQISDLNGTLSTLQQQLQDKTDQLNAANTACDARVAQIQATAQQQINELNADHQSDITNIANLTAQLDTCNQSLTQASLNCQTSGSQTPQAVGSFPTGSISAYALAVDHSGNVVVLDRNQLTIAEFSAAGTPGAQWTPGTLSRPVDIAVDSVGGVYVLDQQAAQPLQKFGSDGTPMAFNASSSQIIYPLGLYISSNDTIYVTDQGGADGCRVLKFDSSGNLLGTFGDVPDLAGAQYNDIAIDENNQTIYVAVGLFNMVAKFDMSGNYLGAWEGDFTEPNGIAIASNGDIFIADTYNNQIDQYDGNGHFKFSFADGLYRPYHIATDSAGKLYAADHQGAQIVIYQ
jgi:NHL repeat